MNYLSNNIRYLRHCRSMSLKDLSNQAAIGKSTVSKWELGTAVPDANRLLSISNIFNVPMLDLLTRDIRFSEKNNNTFISNLHYMLTKTGMSPKGLAQALSLDLSDVQAIISGKIAPTSEQLFRICRIFSLSQECFLYYQLNK